MTASTLGTSTGFVVLNDPDTAVTAVILSERISKMASLDPVVGVESDSDTVDVVETNSPLLLISISGRVTGTNAVLDAFASFIWSLENGQQSTIRYVSARHGIFNVKIDEFSPTDVAGKPNLMNYTLKLIQSL